MMYYDALARMYGLTPRRVSALVKQYGITNRLVYGAKAADPDQFDALMLRLEIPLAPGYKIARRKEAETVLRECLGD